jgi:CRISPR system Cascade subunit CasC
MTRARFIDIHVLQTVPYANLNRDDLGSPKSVIYGGVQRTRVSSQCWKRATREHMEAVLADTIGYDQATRRPVALLVEALTPLGWTEDEARRAAQVIFSAYVKVTDTPAGEDADDDPAANILLFLTRSQYTDLAAIAADARDLILGTEPGKEGKDFKAIRAAITDVIKQPRGVISLFGRMIADLPQANVDAGAQVAHAFTVHESSVEYDYFTAVDDLLGPDEKGAGHLGTAEFATGTYYRYATIDLDDLTANAGDPVLAATLAAQFLTSFAASLPSGKNNVSAPHTRPGLIALAVRGDQPVSYAAAFEQPVRQRGDGYLLPALTRLHEHVTMVSSAYDDAPLWSGHLNAATTDPVIRGSLTGALGDSVEGGLTGLVQAAIDHATQTVPTAA